MAKHSSHILEMAQKGAEHKYAELKAESAALVKNFPHLVGGRRRRSAPGEMPRPEGLPEAKRRKFPRRKLSAKARKAISDAQKKRWPAVKAKK